MAPYGLNWAIAGIAKTFSNVDLAEASHRARHMFGVGPLGFAEAALEESVEDLFLRELYTFPNVERRPQYIRPSARDLNHE